MDPATAVARRWSVECPVDLVAPVGPAGHADLVDRMDSAVLAAGTQTTDASADCLEIDQ